MPKRPVSTYRLQIRAAFDLDAAAQLAPYLRDLGADWAYLSPLLTSTEGSDHGYDVVDPSRVDAARGGPEGLDAFSKAARAAGLGILVDIVPNHMGVADAAQNPWWWDLLRHGRESRYAAAFDVDWEFGGGRVRLPVLGSSFEQAADAGELRVEGDELRYFDHRFPLARGIGHGRRARGPGEGPGRCVDDPRGARAPALRADALGARGVGAQLPPVLRGVHRSPASAWRTRPSSTRPTPRSCGGCDPGSWTVCGSITPTASPTRSAISIASPSRPTARTCWWRRSSSTANACRSTGRPRARRATTRMGEIDRVFVDPAGETALDALDEDLRGSAVPAVAGPHPRHEARHRRHDPPLGGAAPGPAAGRAGRRIGRRDRRAADVLPGVPLVPARRRRSPRAGGG